MSDSEKLDKIIEHNRGAKKALLLIATLVTMLFIFLVFIKK